MHLDIKPPPIIYSGKFPLIHAGGVHAIMFIHGLVTSSFPDPLVSFRKTPSRPSQSVTRRSPISLSPGAMRLPTSLDAIVIADISSSDPSGRLKVSKAPAKDLTRACQVITSGPNRTDSTRRSKDMAISAVVDLLTMPGGATRIMYSFGYQRK